MTLGITVDGVQIPTVNHPKFLGVTFDSLFTSSAHATTITHKMRSRNKVLKALAGSTWGMDKETLLATYKTICRPVANYAVPVWTPSLCDTQWKNIQNCQNAALRTITGCLQMSSIHHLHEETKILPIREHNEMLSKQFLLGCHRRDHPNFNITQLELPPRHVRKDIRIHEYSIQRYMQDPLDQNSYMTALNDIHSDASNSAVSSYRMNVVLGGRPPSIADNEQNLPRSTRVVLAQLRSGWSNRLNAFWSRIDSAIPNLRPACGQGPHNTRHLFNCQSNPTLLCPEDLWTQPVEVARFLGLELSNNMNQN
ncbi:uncharacterized protein ACRADG_008603 isoform 1-T6 [Cochliomyia hominivorax]